jgi:hypothetical protein
MPIEIPDDVLDFLSRRIDSVPHLETLLLFWENPDKKWTAAETAARVYISLDKARSVLGDLLRHGFITAEGTDGYCYHREWDHAQLMPKVAATYRQQLVMVSGLIHEKAASSSVQEFARAFKFSKKD